MPDLISELNRLTEPLLPGEILAFDTLALTESNIYQTMQAIEMLDASDIPDLTPASIQLLAQLAGDAPNLGVVCMQWNKLGKNGVAVAASLAQSKTIHTIFMNSNDLDEHGVDVITHLARSRSIKKLHILDGNNIENDAAAIIIREHNEIAELTKALRSVSGDGAEYESAIEVIKLVGQDTGDDFDNVIELS